MTLCGNLNTYGTQKQAFETSQSNKENNPTVEQLHLERVRTSINRTGWNRLPFTKEEAEAIRSIYGNQGVIDFYDFDREGFLYFHEIFNLNLLETELVVLSACDSGKGKAESGEGFVGITRGFMYAGAEKLVVSLWSVDDKSTAELMKRFYGYYQQGLTGRFTKGSGGG